MRLARALSVAALAVLVAACGSARKIEETSAVNDCARCHGFPPADPHPQSTACDTCHSTTVSAGNVIIPGGTHQNGQVDVTVHPLPYPPDQHGPAADAGPTACTSCHGADYDGGTVNVSCNDCHGSIGYADWKTNCTFCHGTRTQGWTDARLPLAAPPASVAGATAPSDPKVGAHQAHLAGTTLVNPLPCTSCHGVPVRTFPGSLDHINGEPAEIAFSALATQGVPGAAYAGGSCTVYCHGATLQGGTQTPPSWTATAVACNGCHGTPPPTGRHAEPNHQFPCDRCHATVAGSGSPPSITGKALHVNGQKDVAFTVSGTWDAGAKTCTNVACHGGADTRNWNP